MRHSHLLLGFALLGIAAVFVALRPIDVRAQVGGLVGRTHVIVRENNLKMLYATASTSTPPVTVQLREQARSGSVGANPYVVPTGKVFVATDVQVKVSVNFSNGMVLIRGWIGVNGAPLYLLASTFEQPIGLTTPGAVLDYHLTGGVPFDAGSTPQIFHELAATVGGIQTLEVRVLGYETEDIP